ncbi:MAG: CoB--CoM heterodisulfide reductase subunit B [Promethearchaeota archaeon]
MVTKEKNKKLAYSFYLGCVIPNRYPMIEEATRNVLNEFGVDLIEMNGATCCPAPGVFRSFDIPTWETIGARNITIAENNGKNILTMCNGCYGTLLEVNHQLKTDPIKRKFVNTQLKKINREFKGTIKVEHIIEVLYYDIGLETIKEHALKKLGLKCAIHYGCHLLKPAEIRPWGGETEDPKFFDELVEAIGCESVEYKDKQMCCGAGGGLRSAVKEASLDFTRHKLEMIREAGADCIVLACPFCHLQFDLGQMEVNNIFREQIGEPFEIPVFYYTQLLGLSMGLTPDQCGLVKHHNMKGVPPFISQEKALRKVYDVLGYDYDNV